MDQKGNEAGGYRPYAAPGVTQLICEAEAKMLRFSAEDIHKLLVEVPIFKYEMRKYRYGKTL